MQPKYSVSIIGGGLAGCEAAWFLANKNIKVALYEMRGKQNTPIHKTNDLAELVCSNSLKSEEITDASGLLKKEMELFGSIVLEAANASRISGGSSLMVDRNSFSKYITDKISTHKNITIINEETTKKPDGYVIIATGPLTSDKMASWIGKYLQNSDDLYFYDAVAPIIRGEDVDMSICYFKSRYDKGEATYINCPMDKEEYDLFYHELINAKTIKLHDFENVFESCMPIETLAKRGYDSLLYGPLRPVGLFHPITNKRPFGVVQLRPDDFNKSLYNVVGFQTNLTYGEQTRILRLIPGLQNINIVRYGVIHRNTFLNSPKLLKNCQSIQDDSLFFAGQITGVEGYLESASNGILVASYLYQKILTQEIQPLSNFTIMGALNDYLNTPNSNFIPMNANFSIIPEVDIKRRKERRLFYGQRSLEETRKYIQRINQLS